MNHIRDEIRIDAPVEHVWDFLRDTSRWPDWRPRSEFSDFSGPIDTVGTTYVERSRILGFQTRGTHRVLEVEPRRLLHTQSDFGPTDVYFRFEPEGDATRLVVEAEYELPGHLPGLIQDLMTKNYVGRYMRQQMEDFKALAEVTVPVSA